MRASDRHHLVHLRAALQRCAFDRWVESKWVVRTRSAWQSGGLHGGTVAEHPAQRVQVRINRFEEKAGFGESRSRSFAERDPAAGKARILYILACASEAQVSRDTLPGPKMAGMTAASFPELSEEARAEKIWLPCGVDRRVPGTSVGTDCTVVTTDAHSLWRRR